jgi:hypothetical protein
MIFLNFIGAFIRHRWAKLWGYDVMTPPGFMRRREETCNACPRFDEGICTACGCLVFAKIMLATEKCPEGRWNSIWRKRNLTKR